MTEVAPIVRRVTDLRAALPRDREALEEAAREAAVTLLAHLQAGDVTATPRAMAYQIALLALVLELTPAPARAPHLSLVK